MNANDIILVVISGLGVIHGLFLATFLWTYNKGNSLSNKLLSALLVVLSFRIGKSVFLAFTDIDIKLIFTGLSAIMAIGPLYYLFVKSVTEKSFQVKGFQLLQFLPFFLGFVFGLYLEESHWQTLPKLVFIFIFLGYYLHFLIYLISTYRYARLKHGNGLNETIFNFIKLLFYGLLAIWFVYVLNLFDETVPYIVGPILYSIVAYVISFIVFKKDYIQQIDHTKYKTTPVSDEQTKELYSKAIEIVLIKKEFKNPNLTLKSLSETLNVSPQVMSSVINQQSGKNFNGFVNTYRVEEAMLLLKDDQSKNYTIASIAFDVGFNSLSSFNSAFKKITGSTPMAYRG